MLDNLGISAVELKDKLGDVSKAEATVGEVAKAVGDIATASLSKMGAEALTTADEIAQLETAWTNLKTKVGTGLIAAFTPLAKAAGLISQDAQKVAQFTQDISQQSLTELANTIQFQTEQYAKVRAQFIKTEETKDLPRADLARELLRIAQAQYDLKVKEARLGGIDGEAVTPNGIQEKINKQLEEEAKARGNQIENLFYVNEALKLLNAEMEAEGTSLARITEILPEILRLEEQRRTILGEETLAMKALRLENEALIKIEQKRAEEYNKAQEAEAERLRKQAEDNAKERVKIAQDMAEMLIEIERYLATTSEEIRDVELADNQRFYEYRLSEARKGIEELAKSEEESAAIFKAIQDEKNKADEESQEAHNARIFELNKDLADRNAALKDAEQDKNEETQRQAVEVIQAGLTAFGNVYNSMMDIAQNAADFELAILQKKYKEGSISLEYFEAEQIRLQRESAQRAKDAATFNAILGAAQAAINALSSPGVPFPIALAFSAFAVAAAAAQVAAIQSAPLPQFAEGGWVSEGGRIHGRKHSQGGVKIEAEGNEFIIKGKAAQEDPKLFEAFNKGVGKKYIMDNYTVPMINASVLNSFDTIHDSAQLNGLTANLKDHNIIAAMDRNRAATVYGLKMIKEELSKTKRVNIRSKW
jgi:hypothetical protein